MGLVMAICSSVKEYSLSKIKLVDREQDWPVQKIEFRRIQRLNAIKAGTSFLFLTQEDKTGSSRRVGYNNKSFNLQSKPRK